MSLIRRKRREKKKWKEQKNKSKEQKEQKKRTKEQMKKKKSLPVLKSAEAIILEPFSSSCSDIGLILTAVLILFSFKLLLFKLISSNQKNKKKFQHIIKTNTSFTTNIS